MLLDTSGLLGLLFHSLCDAVSFILMRQCRIHIALTTDRHFEQEGIRRLLV